VNSSPEATDFDVSRYPALPRLRGIFVTGTDTGVGKTVIAGAIAVSLRARRMSVEVFKPAASGCRKTPGGLISEDAEFLAACADSRRSLPEITPLRYAPAIAPNVAAGLSRAEVDLDAIFAEYSRLQDAADAVIVEGVGGLLCPISDDFWVIHFAAMTGLPLVIVARPDLGTINHTLLTLSAARAAGIRVAGVVINQYALGPVYAADELLNKDEEAAIRTNPHQIEQRGRTAVLALVPRDGATSVSDVEIGPRVQEAIDKVDWGKIL
jgi:dethiobiotin synthetase